MRKIKMMMVKACMSKRLHNLKMNNFNFSDKFKLLKINHLEDKLFKTQQICQ